MIRPVMPNTRAAARIGRLSFAALRLDTWLPAPPAAVWPLISEPDGINRWSVATVRGLDPGDGGGFGGVGALRQVVLPFGLPVISEVVQEARPPQRFVYRAVGSRVIRYHRGVLALASEGSGTRLRWQVDMALPGPGATTVVQRALRPQLERSLALLAAVVDDAGEPALADRHLEDPADAELAAAAHATAARLGALADAMRAHDDARHWFSRVYQYVTEEMISACCRDELAHPGWALRLIPRFHELYTRSLDGPPEAHWHEAFEAVAVAGRDEDAAPAVFWQALVAGARAHIEGDLPRALASTYVEHYQGRCAYERFRADFLLLAAPLQRAWRRLADEVPARWFPPTVRALHRVLPPEAVEELTAKRFYDPLAARAPAFERGRLLATASP